MATFVLEGEQPTSTRPEPEDAAALGSEILLQNARWFMQVRWLVVAVFGVAALVGALGPAALTSAGIRIPWVWLLSLALGLAAANLAFTVAARPLPVRDRTGPVRVHLWLQIAFDIAAVSLLVHAIGSEQTFISFIYLFHISLACIFFPKRQSLVVVLASIGAYFAVVGLELTALWPTEGVFAQTPPPRGAGVSLLVAASASAIWFIVWYLVSTLSDAVRRRDSRLATLNEHLVRLDREKNMQMLVTTHELKVPFSGIQSNIDILKLQHWTDISEEVRVILDRIDSRARLLSERIGEILYLGDLKSAGATQAPLPPVGVELSALLAGVIEGLEGKAQQRRVRVEAVLPPLTVCGRPERYRALVMNLLSNAVLYSQEGGSVQVELRETEGGALLSIVDHGIGIREDALEHIFDEFYRTKEAARFNRMSSGLGLAIVREIARQHRIRIRVTSQEGTGTAFEVLFPDLEC